MEQVQYFDPDAEVDFEPSEEIKMFTERILNKCELRSKKACSECKYIEFCDKAKVCDGDCGHCDL